jgi:hypothetical protein
MDTTIQTAVAKTFIRYNPERTDYTVSEQELHALQAASQNYWKDICLVSVSVGIPCIINAIAGTAEPFKLTLGLFFNYLFGGLGVILSIVFAIAWRKSRTDTRNIIAGIKSKPRFEVNVTQSSRASDPALILESHALAGSGGFEERGHP